MPFEIPNYGGANYIISLPSLILQTRYMKEMRRVSPFIGCYILELNFAPKINGIRKLKGIKTRLYNLARYARQNDFYEYPKIQDTKEKALVEYIIEKSPASIGDICRNLRMREDEVRDIIYRINERENNIIVEREHKFYIELPLRERFDYPTIERGEKHKHLYLSDTHINSNYTNIEDIYFVVSIAKDEKVEAAFHAGDITESVPGLELYNGQRFRVRTQSAKDLINYVLNFFDIFSKQEIPLYFITGNHDTKISKLIGLDLLELVSQLYSREESKNKIIFVGEERGTVEFNYNDNKLKINMVHPQGGSADTLGYNARKFYRYLKLIGNGKNRVLLIGNYHRAIFIYDPLHFPTYLVPCMKYPDEYVETKGLLIQKGAWITTLELDQKGFVMIENKYIDLPVRENEKTVKSFNGVKISNEIV
ncbi:MAG: metallophosphoesterase [Candidatus Aenigmatarchaeota archaeon]